ncbi:MAG: GNAT family N-acetyltransferase [Chloroflexi bacterium]|nr:GNAT family N-acetyltransferase [Chloroflexota bacterium]
MPAATITVDDDILLRRPSLARAEDIYALVDSNREHLRRWLPWVDAMRSARDEREWLKGELDPGNRWSYAMMVLHRDELVGMIGIMGLASPSRAGEIGYWLAEDAQGRGIITRSCSASLDYLFGVEGMNRIQIRAATGNTRSLAIPERLGFAFEGVQRQAELVNGQFLDLAMYSMLKEEWKTPGKATPLVPQ